MSRLLRADDPQLEAFATEVQRWGQRMNLVGSTEREAIAVHVADSTAPAGALPPGAALADLGSGAGFPGIPLAIARSDARVTLVESRERRAHFLRHAVRVLSLSAEVQRVRFETIAPARFDVVCLRAVGPLEGVLEPARGWARPGGELWIWSRLEPGELDPRASVVADLGSRGAVVRVPVGGIRTDG